MLTGWQPSKRICVAEHFEDEQQMSQCQVGEKTGKVVCPLFIMYTSPLSTLISSLSLNHHLYADTDGDLTKEMK